MSDQSTAQDTWDALLCEPNQFGTRYWFDERGEFHRENGPAIIWADGYIEYWIDNQSLTEEQFNTRKLTING